MVKLRNETSREHKKPLIKPNSLALIAILVILILFVINSNSPDEQVYKSDLIDPIDNNLFKCYDLVKNSSDYFKSFAKTKPKINQLKDYLSTHLINPDLELKNEWLIENYYNDLNSDHISNAISYINSSKIELIQTLIVNNLSYNPFEDTMFEKLIRKQIKKNAYNQIGILNWFEKDYYPWLEAVFLLNSPKSNLINIDMHTNKFFESTQIKSVNLNHFLANNINSYLNNIYLLNEFKFDVLVSYNGVEQIGLGKYGENLWLDADYQFVNLINCMLKPNGLFVLTLSVCDQDKSFLEFNARRIYGKNRLNSLLLNNNNWILVDRLKYNHGNQEIFILRKNLNKY